MKKALKLIVKKTISVSTLVADRNLRIDLTGEISAELRGEIHPGLWGNLSGLRGDLSGLRGDLSDLRGEINPDLRGNLSGLLGDLSDLRGDLSGLWGNLSSLRGDLSDLWGDLDECEITDEERAAGVDITTLIEEQ